MRQSVLNCVKNSILDFFGIYLRRKSLPRGVLLKHDVLKLYKGKSLNLIWDVGAHRGETAHWTGNQRLWYWNALFAKEELM